MSLTKLTENLNNVSNLANQPTEAAEELKTIFDKSGNTLKDYINNSLIPEVESTYMPYTGGTFKGNINTLNVLPSKNDIYSLGSSVNNYKNVYANWLVQKQPIRKGSTTYFNTAFGFVWTGTALRVAINGDDGDNKYLVHSMENEINLYWNGSRLELWVNGVFVGYLSYERS